MARIVLKVPKSAITAQEGQLVEWFVEDGAEVRLGQPIYAIETEKSTLEIECPFEGVIRHIGRVGQTYSVGEPIAEIIQ